MEKEKYDFEDKGEEMGENHEADGPMDYGKKNTYKGVNKKALKVNMGIGKSGLKGEHEPGYTMEESRSEDGGPFRKGKTSLAKMANMRKGVAYGDGR